MSFITPYRTDALLYFGVIWLGIISPSLQVAFAFLYFRMGHIWSRVLNKELEKYAYEDKFCPNLNFFKTIDHLLNARTLY